MRPLLVGRSRDGGAKVTIGRIEVRGHCDERFEAVRQEFAENFERREEIGAAVAVTIDGEPVVDLWGGDMDRSGLRPWREDTIVTVYSTTKGMAAICAHRLADQGLLDLDAPVARYWPEFAQAGKSQIPVNMLLSHRAGLPAVSGPLPEDAIYDADVMTAALARQAPFWEPGTRHGYHALTYGWLIGDVVRRVSGKSLGTYFREEVAAPLGLDFHIGTGPEHDARIATMYAFEPTPEEAARIDREREMTRSQLDPRLAAALTTIVIPPDGHNTEQWKRTEIPAANGHSDARSLARVYGALACGGTLDGVEVLSPEAIAGAAVEQANGPDATSLTHRRFGLGFWLSLDGDMGDSEASFGHPGAGGSVGFADPERRVGFGYVMNQMKQGLLVEGTGRSLINALYASF